ncbi:unnamed protein product [Trichobilharzia szidati]|nr:unnamed protein product [Trichobilharzia szidati]
MPFSPLELLSDENLGRFSKDVAKANEEVLENRGKHNGDEKSSVEVTLTKLLSEDIRNGCQTTFDHNTSAQFDADSQKISLSPVENIAKSKREVLPENSSNSNWRSVPDKWELETIYIPQDEIKISENTESVSDQHSYQEYSKIDIDDKKSIEEKHESNENSLQSNIPPSSVTPTSVDNLKNIALDESNTNDTAAYIEVTESEKDASREIPETEVVVKPVARTRKHIPNVNQQNICDISLTSQQADHSFINIPILTSKEQQNLLRNNNDGDDDNGNKNIPDIIIKTVNQNSMMKRSKSSCSLSNQKAYNKNAINKSLHNNKGDEHTVLSANILRDLAFSSWCNRLTKSARVQRLSSLRNEIDETKKEKEKLERMKSNEISFQTWKQKKRQILIDTIKKRKAEELAQKKKLEEERERKLNSQKAFEVWKARKDELIIKQQRELSTKRKQEKETKETEQNEKQYLCQKAFEDWKSKKDTILQQSLKHQRKCLTEKERQQEELNRRKLEQAAEAYYQWELKKILAS